MCSFRSERHREKRRGERGEGEEDGREKRTEGKGKRSEGTGERGDHSSKAMGNLFRISLHGNNRQMFRLRLTPNTRNLNITLISRRSPDT